eukprot:471372-Rhodomonas_salina.1
MAVASTRMWQRWRDKEKKQVPLVRTAVPKGPVRVRYCASVWSDAVSGTALGVVLCGVRYCASVWSYAVCGTALAYGAVCCARMAHRTAHPPPRTRPARYRTGPTMGL